MKKSHIRDYATEAFRFFSVKGSSEDYKKELWEEAILEQKKSEGRGGIGSPSEAAITRAEKKLESARAEIADLEAVERTIITLERMNGGNEMITALRIVYMVDPDKDIEKGEIEERVHIAEITIPESRATVYRQLARARFLFAVERGLRI